MKYISHIAHSLVASYVYAADGPLDYSSNGANWGTTLAKMCDTGREQSPIDLDWAEDSFTYSDVMEVRGTNYSDIASSTLGSKVTSSSVTVPY